MKKNEKPLILTWIAVITLIAAIVGGAYAYFVAKVTGGTSANISASTGTTDSLSFDVGDPIMIDGDLKNFVVGMNSLKGTTTASATLLANNTTSSAKAKYNVFFILETNDFVYTTDDNQAELILKVTDPKGNEVVDITGLKKSKVDLISLLELEHFQLLKIMKSKQPQQTLKHGMLK
ncbi:MAG: hypothetical protein K2M17_00225 [Bacilli bacterium]|nr:hypothetical protein [Bacilli bacterium]